MAHRLQPLRSVSCACGHGYCVFCTGGYQNQQRLRASCPPPQLKPLMHFEASGDELDAEDQPRADGLQEPELSRSRPQSLPCRIGSRKSSQAFRGSQTEEPNVEALAPDFSSRAEFLIHGHEVTLDPDSAFRDLALSEANRRVTNIGRSQGHLPGPDRFSFFWQVLSVDSLAGRAYVELDWSGPWVYVALAYPSMQRYGNGRECGFGGNTQSWALHCRRSGFSFWHNAEKTHCTSGGGPEELESTVGVYLDHTAGVMTFYSVQDDTMVPLHRVRTRFTQRLLIGLWLAVDASAVFRKFTSTIF